MDSTMKTLFSYILIACAIIAALGAGAGLAALMPAQSRTVLSAEESVTIPAATPAIASLPKEMGLGASQIIEVERAFDTNKLRQDEIGHLLKNAGYNLTESELGTVRRLVNDYGWLFVVERFRATEISALRLYNLTTTENPAQVVRHIFAIADKMAANEVDLFVNSMVLKKYGLSS